MSTTENTRTATEIYLSRPAPFILRSNLALGSIILIIGVAGMVSKSIGFAICGAAVALLCVPFAPMFSILFFAVLLGGCYYISAIPIDIGPFKIYGVDALGILCFWAVFSLVIARSVHDESVIRHLSPGERSLVIWLAIWLAYGIFEMAYGFVEGYAYDLVLGDYRRYCFYMAGFACLLFIPLRPRHLRILPAAIIAGGLAILCFAVWRIVTGKYPVEQEDNATGYVYARLITLAEGGTLTLLVSYAAAFILDSHHALRRLAALAVICVALPFFVLSGYRYLMAVGAITPIVTFLFLVWLRRSGFRPYIAPLALIVAALGVVAVLAPLVLGSELQKAFTDLSVRLQSTSATGEWRYWVWRQALEEFSQSITIGRGFGHDLVVLFRGTGGELMYIKASAHNTFLTVLYRTGVVGLIIFTVFHVKFYRYAIRHARIVATEHHALYAALFVFSVAMLGNSLLQPFEVAQFVLLYLAMGFMALLIRDGENRQQSPYAAKDVSA